MDNPSPLIKQGWLRAALFVLVFFAGAISIGLFFEKSTASSLLPILVSTVFSVALAALFRRIVDRRSVMSMGFQWRGFQHHGWIGFCLGIALLGLGTLVLFATQHLYWSNVQLHADDLFIAFVLMMLVALGEEIVFRGYILRNLLRSMNKWVALVVSAFIFAVAHAGNPGITSLAAVNILLGGLLLGLNYIYTRNLWFALLFHLSWNFFQGPVLGYEVSGLAIQSVLAPELKGPAYLTGAEFGFEGSMLATIVLAIAVLVMVLVYERKYKLSK